MTDTNAFEATLIRLEKELIEFKDKYNDDINLMAGIMTEFKDIKKKVDEHDRILVRGNTEPSLQETVRVLSKTVNDYIERKNKEEERWNKIWVAITVGISIPFVITIAQAFLLMFRIYPLLEALGK